MKFITMFKYYILQYNIYLPCIGLVLMFLLHIYTYNSNNIGVCAACVFYFFFTSSAGCHQIHMAYCYSFISLMLFILHFRSLLLFRYFHLPCLLQSRAHIVWLVRTPRLCSFLWHVLVL